jgi:hypothetical protein
MTVSKRGTPVLATLAAVALTSGFAPGAEADTASAGSRDTTASPATTIATWNPAPASTRSGRTVHHGSASWLSRDWSVNLTSTVGWWRYDWRRPPTSIRDPL